MDPQAKSKAEASYEARNDLALLSAVADPVAEPRSNPPEPPTSPKSPKSKRLSMKGSDATKPTQQANGNSQKSSGGAQPSKVCSTSNGLNQNKNSIAFSTRGMRILLELIAARLLHLKHSHADSPLRKRLRTMGLIQKLPKNQTDLCPTTSSKETSSLMN